MKKLLKNNTLDIIAIASSLICAIHCAAIPIVLSFSSLSSLHFIENSFIEWFFIILGLLFVFTSLWPSYKKNHNNKKALIFASLGYMVIAIGRFEFTEFWEISNTVIGALLVSLAHYFNWVLLKNKNNHSH